MLPSSSIPLSHCLHSASMAKKGGRGRVRVWDAAAARMEPVVALVAGNEAEPIVTAGAAHTPDHPVFGAAHALQLGVGVHV